MLRDGEEDPDGPAEANWKVNGVFALAVEIVERLFQVELGKTCAYNQNQQVSRLTFVGSVPAWGLFSDGPELALDDCAVIVVRSPRSRRHGDRIRPYSTASSKG